jgi:hypothetical protein
MADRVSNKTQHVAPVDSLYTVLLVIAASLQLFGTIFIAVRAIQQFGSLWPPAGG